MTYPTMADVNATNDLSQLLIYTNTVTNGLAMPIVLFGFFMIVFLGGFFMQLRFRGTGRMDFAFAVASFTTFGMAVLMSTQNGLLNPSYLIITMGLAILSAFILYLTQD